MSGLPDPSDKVEPGKEEGSRTRIVHETGCNQILVCFPLAKSPTTGPNVLKIPFSEVTPKMMREYIVERERPLSAAALEPERKLEALEWIAWATGTLIGSIL
jgi:hypothetical protein